MWTTNGLTTRPSDLEALLAQGVVSLDMETAAIAELCEARGIPWSVFRVISDRASDGTVDEEVFHLSNQDGTPNRGGDRALHRRTPRTAAAPGADGRGREPRDPHRGGRRDRSVREDPLMRFAIIGAGMAGILSAIKLSEAGLHRLHGLREGRSARRHLAREHLSRASRATCRRISTRTRSRPPPSGATASRPAPRSTRTSSASRASTTSSSTSASATRSRAARSRRPLAPRDRRRATTTRSTS